MASVQNNQIKIDSREPEMKKDGSASASATPPLRNVSVAFTHVDRSSWQRSVVYDPSKSVNDQLGYFFPSSWSYNPTISSLIVGNVRFGISCSGDRVPYNNTLFAVIADLASEDPEAVNQFDTPISFKSITGVNGMYLTIEGVDGLDRLAKKMHKIGKIARSTKGVDDPAAAGIKIHTWSDLLTAVFPELSEKKTSSASTAEKASAESAPTDTNASAGPAPSKTSAAADSGLSKDPSAQRAPIIKIYTLSDFMKALYPDLCDQNTDWAASAGPESASAAAGAATPAAAAPAAPVAPATAAPAPAGDAAP